jgi:hypothetical protein
MNSKPQGMKSMAGQRFEPSASRLNYGFIVHSNARGQIISFLFNHLGRFVVNVAGYVDPYPRRHAMCGRRNSSSITGGCRPVRRSGSSVRFCSAASASGISPAVLDHDPPVEYFHVGWSERAGWRHCLCPGGGRHFVPAHRLDRPVRVDLCQDLLPSPLPQYPGGRHDHMATMSASPCGGWK